jgi:hypothetical protein
VQNAQDFGDLLGAGRQRKYFAEVLELRFRDWGGQVTAG